MLRNNLKSFTLWKMAQPSTDIDLKNKLQLLGIKLELETGHLFYTKQFTPLSLDYELIFIRHGETFGNCGQSLATGLIDLELVQQGIKNNEKRIYQGNGNCEINQLTEYGKQQALQAADKLNEDFLKKGWEPDVIYISPLTRAIDTAQPFVKCNQFEDRCILHEGIREMSFGCWENRRICDIHSDDPCHLFYRSQHSLVKNESTDGNHVEQRAENFCEVILRAYKVLMNLNEIHPGKKILMFSHSMYGAACCILLGHGQQIEDKNYLAFDGKRKDGTYYTMPNAIPFPLKITTGNLPINDKRKRY